MITLLLFIAGLVLLIVGAEVLVRGASRLATAAGISPLAVGLTVVAFGTSSPELAVSIQSAWAGQPDLTVGNVVGSNIFNVLFILGISALIVPLVVAQQLVRWDVPLMIGVSLLSFVMAFDAEISRLDAALLVLGLVAYVVFAIRQSRRESPAVQSEYQRQYAAGEGAAGQSLIVQCILIVVGLGLLVLGSRWLVNGATAVAAAAGLSELIIGLTIVAAGTSLPEVATSILASIRGERDIAVGNVVGSNIFNILAVLGLSGLFAPGGIPVSSPALRFDMPVMIAVAVACLPIFYTGFRIARWEGFVFLAYYAFYTIYLILDAQGHTALPAFSAAMLAIVIPLTFITLLVLAVRSFGRKRGGAGDQTQGSS